MEEPKGAGLDPAGVQRAESFSDAQGVAGDMNKMKPRWTLSDEGRRKMEEVYAQSKFPSPETRERLCREVGGTMRQIQVWFQNKRQREQRHPVDGSFGVPIFVMPQGMMPGVFVQGNLQVGAMPGAVSPALVHAQQAQPQLSAMHPLSYTSGTMAQPIMVGNQSFAAPTMPSYPGVAFAPPGAVLPFQQPVAPQPPMMTMSAPGHMSCHMPTQTMVQPSVGFQAPATNSAGGVGVITVAQQDRSTVVMQAAPGIEVGANTAGVALTTPAVPVDDANALSGVKRAREEPESPGEPCAAPSPALAKRDHRDAEAAAAVVALCGAI